MEKIPTPVIIGGGALVALVLMRMSGAGSGIKTMATAPNTSQTDLATIDAKAQGFATVVNDFTSLALRQVDMQGGIDMLRIQGQNNLAIAESNANVVLAQAKYQADAVRQASSDSLAAQRSAQRGETSRSVISGLIQGGLQLVRHFFGG